MARRIQATLDDETAALLARLQKQLNCSKSEVIRQAIRQLAEVTLVESKRRLAGAGKYDFGIPDLSTNKKYLEGFGE